MDLTTAVANRLCTAFEGSRRIASGKLAHVVLKAKEVIDRGERGPVLIFDDQTSQFIEVDFRGTGKDGVERLVASAGQFAKEAEPDQQESVGPRGLARASETGRCAAGGNAAAAALGMAEQ